MDMPDSFLSSSRGGHRTPSLALLINIAPSAVFETSNLPDHRFCLAAYNGEPRACILCFLNLVYKGVFPTILFGSHVSLQCIAIGHASHRHEVLYLL